ncbi:MAG TPA: hypothetical protein VMN82_02605 [Thermoanaerobaculia bacterium]|nr:hypothetical protein [Thermoanaerobaculia bacterium]
MKAPWEKFSLPGSAVARALGRSPEFVRTLRQIFGPLVERVDALPPEPQAWVMAEVPGEGSLSAFFRELGKALEPAGSLWVVLPKQPFAAELGFPYRWVDVQKAGLSAGLVDNKVAAFSARLTSIRFVVPLSRRRKA